ncbi:hypothetical protein H9P43_005809 [Blastocladiella emersonii ATCC 22665]|nr:hypothetical protein H9P43_005809 [Blastocladiella emersonii ATCC 22665]
MDQNGCSNKSIVVRTASDPAARYLIFGTIPPCDEHGGSPARMQLRVALLQSYTDLTVPSPWLLFPLPLDAATPTPSNARDYLAALGSSHAAAPLSGLARQLLKTPKRLRKRKIAPENAAFAAPAEETASPTKVPRFDGPFKLPLASPRRPVPLAPATASAGSPLSQSQLRSLARRPVSLPLGLATEFRTASMSSASTTFSLSSPTSAITPGAPMSLGEGPLSSTSLEESTGYLSLALNWVKVAIKRELERIGMHSKHPEYVACHKLVYDACKFQMGAVRLAAADLTRTEVVNVVQANFERTRELILMRLG